MKNITYTKNKERSTDKNNLVLDFSPISFCFVGPRGVGKTSLLASMYEEIKTKKVSGFSIDIYTDAGKETLQRLNKAYESMLEMLEDTPMHELAEVGVDQGFGLGGTKEAREYEITGEQQVSDETIFKWYPWKTFRYKFRFTDMPGEFYDSESKPEDKAYAKNVLNNSLVSFLSIDAPALMDTKLKNKRLNESGNICEMYKNATWEFGHTVIIVLSRCEKFWEQKEEMEERVNQYYGSTINELKAKGVRVFITWVKTLGGMEFDHFTKVEKDKKITYIAHFVHTGEYHPENCATPLQIALQYGLERLADIIEPGILDDLGFTYKRLAKEATVLLAEELKKTLNRDDKNTFKEL